MYINNEMGLLDEYISITNQLNTKIEIIEEDKKIEKLERVNGSDLVDLQKNNSLVDQNKAVANLIMYLNMNVVKINELIDELNKLKVSK